MGQYIDKSAVVAEIEKRIKEIDEIGTYLSPKGILTNLLCHLNTIEVKEVQEKPVSNDLEETLKDYAYQVAYDLSHDWLKENATWDDVETAVKLGAQWQKQQLIDKACDWLSLDMKMLMNVLDVEYDTHDIDIKDFIEDFKNHMKG